MKRLGSYSLSFLASVSSLVFIIMSPGTRQCLAQETVIVRPQEIDDVLVNPGIGFMTFQRFNGDKLNVGKRWTEGFPIEYREFDGDLRNENYPMTSLAYFRIYWKFIEPEMDEYRWDLIDKALQTARERKQTLMLRIAPYGTGPETDAPAWYRALVGERKPLPVKKWQVDPEDPRYALHFGDLIRSLGRRYDGHPDLESVDLAIVGAWGEGAGSDRLTQITREALVDSYLESFKQTPLLMLLTDEKTNKYGLSKRDVGWRVDCLGDLGGFSPTWCHMYDYYPQAIIRFGMKDAWKKAPVSFEACWVMQHWKDNGWDIDYIIDQSLKWHISSFNAKSSPVPDEWWPQVNRWLKKMGYRFVLRKFTYTSVVRQGGKIVFTSWWENKGVAPCYKPFTLALRLIHEGKSEILPTKADIRTWLPGDNLYDSHVVVPVDLPAGRYDLDIGLLDPRDRKAKVKLAIKGMKQDGWYNLGKITVKESSAIEREKHAGVRRKAIFASGTNGYHTYRIPSIIVTNSGTVLAFCEGRKHSRSDTGDIDILIRRSTDGGQTWSDQEIVWDDGPNTCGNPCPVVDRETGVICLLMTHNLGTDSESEIVSGTSEGARTVWISYSHDDGVTWTEPMDITSHVKKPGWTWYATGPGVGIQLRLGRLKGRLVVPCDHKTGVDKIGYYSHIIYSDDHGKTWKLGGPTEDGVNECQVIERTDGSLLLNMRRSRTNPAQVRAVATSNDGGMTWSKLFYDETLIGPRCQASLLRYTPADESGQSLVLFSNPAHRSERVRMTVRLSRDDCRSWSFSKVIHAGPSAYSCLAVLPDGSIGCLYEGGRDHPYENIILSRFSLEWLRSEY